MSDTPAYRQVERKNRALALRDFITTCVIPEDFEMDDLDVLEKHLDESDSKVEAFCEWFELGNWFIDEMNENEFDIDELIIVIRNTLILLDREAAEEYRERQRDYNEMVRGSMYQIVLFWGLQGAEIVIDHRQVEKLCTFKFAGLNMYREILFNTFYLLPPVSPKNSLY